MKVTIAKENENPVCKFCEKELDEVICKPISVGSHFIYLCPYCKKSFIGNKILVK